MYFSSGSSRNQPKANTNTSFTRTTEKGNSSSSAYSEEAQKKFANAKGISSDQFFENDKSRVSLMFLNDYL